MSSALFEWSQDLDERSDKKRKRSMNPINKIIRNKKKIKLQVDEAKRLSADKKKKMSYQGKGNLQGNKGVDNSISSKVTCASCGEEGHRRSSHRLCRNNKKNIAPLADMFCKPTGKQCVEDDGKGKNAISTVGLTVCDVEYDENILGGHTVPLKITTELNL